MENTLPTIDLKGKEYVEVKERVIHFNDTYKKGMIVAEYKQLGDIFTFKATITPDIVEPSRVFVAHSQGQVTKEKSFEKLETVAVGRALAFMGIGVIEGVASADEIVEYQKKQLPTTTSKAPVEDFIDPNDLIDCQVCGSPYKYQKPGVSKKSGKPYDGFYSCSTRGCTAKTIQEDDAENYLKKNRLEESTTFSDGTPLPEIEDLPF